MRHSFSQTKSVMLTNLPLALPKRLRESDGGGQHLPLNGFVNFILLKYIQYFVVFLKTSLNHSHEIHKGF
jgi:hypothetical protein